MRIAPGFLATVLLGACASPEQFDPTAAPGPAVATATRDAMGGHDWLADATIAADAPGPESPASGSIDAPVDAGTSADSVALDAAPDAQAPDRAPDTAPDMPTGPPPTVVRIPDTSAPARLPPETKVTCLAGPNVLVHADCPVVQWLGNSYWTLSYKDNRIAATLVGYDTSGRIVKELTFDNVRYIWNVEVDAVRGELVFHFQDSRIVAIKWEDLRVP